MSVTYSSVGVQMIELKHKTGKVSFVSCLRDLLETDGHKLSEEMIFGLGCGLGFSYDRSRGMVGALRRPENFYQTFVKNYGGKYDCQKFNFKTAWLKIKWALDRKKPVVVGPLDLKSLTYIKFSESRPTHFVTIVGYEGHYVYVYDCRSAKQEKLSMERLEEAWMPDTGLFRFTLPEKPHDLKPLLPSIMLQFANAFIDAPSERLGIRGETSLSEELGSWDPSDDELETTLARLKASGGPAYRDVYGWFLVEAKERFGHNYLEKAAKEIFRAGDLWKDFTSALETAKKAQSAGGRRTALETAAEEMRRISVVEGMAFGSLRYAAQRI